VLITPEYVELNKKLFNVNPEYGTSGVFWAKYVKALAENPRSILDYGCGRRTLEQALGYPIQNYDPAIPRYSESPDPADLVACTDVLEHIEPECLDAVLDDLKRVVRKTGFFVIATKPASKTLADGRNAHLIVKPMEWWLPKLSERFQIVSMANMGFLFAVVVKAK
jgi:hypothetical protein